MNIITFDPEKQYLGCLCKRGHNYQGRGKSVRYLKGGGCILCSREYYRLNSWEIQQRQRQYAAMPPKPEAERQRRAGARERQRRYRSQAKNRERIRQYQASYQASPAARQAKLKWYEANKQRVREQERLRNRTPEGREACRIRKLRRLVRKQGNIAVPYTPAAIEQLKKSFDNCCAYCGDSLENRGQIDHVVPISKGGADSIFNLVPACTHCNCRKHNKLLEDWYPCQPFFDLDRLNRIREIIGAEK